MEESEVLELALIENLMRKDLDPFEEAVGYQRLHDKYGYTHEKIARAVGKSRSLVTETLTLTRIPEEIRQLCRHAGISARSILVEIAKAEDLMTMRRLIDMYATGDDRTAIRRARRDSQSEESTDSRKPFIFRVSDPNADFTLSLRFKEEEVSREKIIETLSEIIQQLKTELREDPDGETERQPDPGSQARLL